VEKMKIYKFYRENDIFDDILNDPILKKVVDLKIQFPNFLIIGINEEKKNEQTFSYITLKYGDEMQQSINKDFSPIPGIDYTPEKDISKYSKTVE
jgi:hypothetical protein